MRKDREPRRSGQPWIKPDIYPLHQRRDIGASDSEPAQDCLLAATTVAPTDWALGIAARCRALLSEGDAADDTDVDRLIAELEMAIAEINADSNP